MNEGIIEGRKAHSKIQFEAHLSLKNSGTNDWEILIHGSSNLSGLLIDD